MLNESNKQSGDINTINLNEQWQIDYWIDVLGCTESQLRSVIKIVGNKLSEVKKYFVK
ncbi:MAG: DUF3606 domain-containing protein [Bacteroidetes bacterium]|nr:DUF3606 domain-containing protein [Bacteroidota bacterium]